MSCRPREGCRLCQVYQCLINGGELVAVPERGCRLCQQICTIQKALFREFSNLQRTVYSPCGGFSREIVKIHQKAETFLRMHRCEPSARQDQKRRKNGGSHRFFSASLKSAGRWDDLETRGWVSRKSKDFCMP